MSIAMNKKIVSLPVLMAVTLMTAVVRAETEQKVFPATLKGHAIVPAVTFAPAPADAPQTLTVSGRFTASDNIRTDVLYSVKGATWLAPENAPRYTGLSLPFVGQPIQGFSGIKSIGDGEYIVLSDNGFGSKRNSPDALLMMHRVKPDWETGKVDILNTVFLHDSDRMLPFRLVNEHTKTRYLTGSDFDIESIQPVGDALWFGDEFGPYLFATDLDGKVIAFHETIVEEKIVQSPDNHQLSLPATPGEVTFDVRRSRGFEGMALSPNEKYLYPLFEGPLWDQQQNTWENHDGKEYLRIVEFDIAKREFTGRNWKYLLEENGNNIGDFNLISPTRALVIERDNGEGDPKFACADTAKSDCFSQPAQFKRVYLIDLENREDDFVNKIGYIDLMAIKDPEQKAQTASNPTENNVFNFPFVTIESVDRVDEQHIIVGNDNNLPFSTGRTIGQPDDNEFILLEVSDMLSE